MTSIFTLSLTYKINIYNYCINLVIHRYMKLPESLKLITDTLWQIEDKKDFKWAFEDLLTPSEIVSIAERINIFRLLKEGKSQREIAKDLEISITTVTRWNRVLQYECRAIKKYI